jgi:hypothetical protein
MPWDPERNLTPSRCEYGTTTREDIGIEKNDSGADLDQDDHRFGELDVI